MKKLKTELRGSKDKTRAAILQCFFKTGKGEYGEGDQFYGITVPTQRKIAAKYHDLDVSSTIKLLKSPIHEERFIALLILANKFKHATKKEQRKLHLLYLKYIRHINNWDLVDLSAPVILGAYLFDKKRTLLPRLAHSKRLWERRISIIATYFFIQRGDPSATMMIAKKLLHDTHDLIHKAVGWMLREVGKHCGVHILEKFLETHAANMPRTMLRYAVEKLPSADKEYYMKKRVPKTKKPS